MSGLTSELGSDLNPGVLSMPSSFPTLYLPGTFFMLLGWGSSSFILFSSHLFPLLLEGKLLDRKGDVVSSCHFPAGSAVVG